MPPAGVYFVFPSRIAFAAASLMCSGVSKSGSPSVKNSTGAPCLANAFALPSIAIVGDAGSSWQRRESADRCLCVVPTIIAAESKQHSDGNDLARVRPNVSGRPSPAQPVDDDLELRYRELCEFVSIISHDLRNPLAAIRGYAQLLHRQARDDSFAALRPSLATIMEQADRLAGFTELLLDVARIRTSRVALQWVTVDLAPLAREASQTLTPPAKID